MQKPGSIATGDAGSNISVDWRRFAVMFLLMCALFVLRRPDALGNPQFWAEDGKLLFQSQLTHGGWSLAIQPYRGYFIMETRLAAALATLFPIGWAPLIYNLISIAIEGFACSLFSLPWYAYLVRSYTLRVAVCVAAAGALYAESLINNLCNAQWYLAIAGLLLLIRQPPPKERYDNLLTACGVVVAALSALTNPVLVVTVPICLWQLFVRRRNRAISVALLTGILGQVACFFLSPPPPSATGGHPLVQIDHLVGSLVISAVYRVVISSMAGWRTADMLSASDAYGVFLCVLTGAVVWLTWLLLRVPPVKRLQLVSALYIGAATLIMPLRVRGLSAAFNTVTRLTESRGEQYFVIASFVFLFLLAITAESLWAAKGTPAAAAFFLLLVAGGVLGNFRVPALPDLQWSRYVPQLEVWSQAHEAGAPNLGLSVPTNPDGWSIHLPAVFNSLSVFGFPDHVALGLNSDSAMSVGLAPGFVHNSDPIYVSIPAALDANRRYRVQATIAGPVPSTASLFVHSALSAGVTAESPRMPINPEGVVLSTEIRGDESGLCVHIRSQVDGGVTFRAISVSPL